MVEDRNVNAPGFKSRWMTPHACMYATADVILRTNVLASTSDSVLHSITPQSSVSIIAGHSQHVHTRTLFRQCNQTTRLRPCIRLPAPLGQHGTQYFQF